MIERDLVDDPDDPNVCYWVAWAEEDNPNEFCRASKYRVFRDDRNKPKGEPITEAMSREEAYEYLNKLALLLGSETRYGNR